MQTFIPKVGTVVNPDKKNGYTGTIEYVGKDYFVLRSARTNEPILIKPFLYHNFEPKN